MTPEDLAQLYARAFPDSAGWDAETFRSFAKDPTCFILTRPQGFALIRVIADEAELLSIATHPDQRRRGVARDLMNRWHAEAAARGAARAFLEVATDNIPARALYDSLGYQPEGRRKAYYRRRDGSHCDALLMACAL